MAPPSTTSGATLNPTTLPSNIITSTNATTTNGDYHLRHAASPPPNRKKILHLGDSIQHNHELYDRLRSQFEFIRTTPGDLERSAFKKHLSDRTWGDFSAILRPFWRSGKNMGDWDEELIDLLPKSMEVMASAGAGFDWVRDRYMAERGIIYCNGAGASTISVAETALYLIIGVFRHMTASSLAARSGSPRRWIEAHNSVPSRSRNPGGHTLGIVGLGNIGLKIAQKVKAALEMRLLYTDICRKLDQEEGLGIEYYEKLESMLPHCDCVLLATPAGPPILTAQTLALLPRGARVINIARGGLIDENALADALDSGHIDAAALDVHEDEPKVNSRLAQMENVELMSHTGGGSIETNVGFERLTMENVDAVLNGREAVTPVNLRWLKRGGVNSVAHADGNGQSSALQGINSDHPANVNSGHHPTINGSRSTNVNSGGGHQPTDATYLNGVHDGSHATNKLNTNSYTNGYTNGYRNGYTNRYTNSNSNGNAKVVTQVDGNHNLGLDHGVT